MTALAKIFSWVTGADVDVETLKTLLVFSGLGLLISLVCMMAYGLDISIGFF
jgi:hypothetical protein